MVLLSAATPSSCGELSPEEQARMDAVMACGEKASALFQILAVMQEPTPDEEGSVDGLDLLPKGDFTWNVTAKGKSRPLPDRLICRGNLTDRTIQAVEFNGVVKRPANQEVWKY